MDRRNFIKSNAVLTASILLPKAVFSQTTRCSRSTYTGKMYSDNSNEYWSLSGYICEKMTMNFDVAEDQDKLFDLNIRYYKDGLSKPLTQKGKYVFQITDIKTNATTKTAICKAKLKSIDKDGYTLPKKMFNKRRITLSIITSEKKRIITINSKKGELTKISRTISSSSGKSGCYLTTAVVQHRQLSDNCSLLRTLRGLRDYHMLNSKTGSTLVNEYYQKAPELVQKINSFANSDEIYEYMYKNMIKPSAALVKQGKTDEAISLYRIFSELLHEAYN